MRKFFAAAAVFFLFLMLPLNAAAISEASRVQNAASVYNDGSCQISLQITFHLDEPVKELSFPIPKKAQDVTINGSRARVRRSGDVLNVDLSGLVGGFAGDFSINIRYTLSNIVKRGESGRLELTLPLLSGFAYPVESMDFTVTLPGEISSQPTFTSIYYQARIEEMLSFNVLGANISGALTTPLKDREALTMVLEVSEDMFPQSTVAEWSMNVDDIAMTVLAVLCVLYWLVFLRCLPPSPSAGLRRLKG